MLIDLFVCSCCESYTRDRILFMTDYSTVWKENAGDTWKVVVVVSAGERREVVGCIVVNMIHKLDNTSS